MGDRLSKIISVISSDAQLLQLVRETGSPCSVVGRDALSTLAQPGGAQPDVVVIDIREPAGIPPAVAVLKRHHPATGVLLVAAKLDPALMLEAMRAGVNEFVTEPLTVADLQVALKRLVGSLASPAQGDIFAVIGAKGGVGATTVAVNAATALAKAAPGSTLLVDLNVACGDAAVFLGAEPRFSVMDALENVQRLDAAFFSGIVVHTKSGLDLLGASGRPVTANFDTARIRTLLDFASRVNRFTVLDVPRSDTVALDSLDSVTKIMLVVNQELATVRTAARMAATLRQRYGQSRLHLVLTRTDRRAEIGHDDVEKTVGVEIEHTFPSDYRLALQAMNKGRPLVLDGQHELSKAFTAFARDLAGLHAPAQRTDNVRAAGLFGRLAPRKA
jgi:pilus assembly protein CpaE